MEKIRVAENHELVSAIIGLRQDLGSKEFPANVMWKTINSLLTKLGSSYHPLSDPELQQLWLGLKSEVVLKLFGIFRDIGVEEFSSFEGLGENFDWKTKIVTNTKTHNFMILKPGLPPSFVINGYLYPEYLRRTAYSKEC